MNDGQKAYGVVRTVGRGIFLPENKPGDAGRRRRSWAGWGLCADLSILTRGRRRGSSRTRRMRGHRPLTPATHDSWERSWMILSDASHARIGAVSLDAKMNGRGGPARGGVELLGRPAGRSGDGIHLLGSMRPTRKMRSAAPSGRIAGRQKRRPSDRGETVPVGDMKGRRVRVEVGGRCGDMTLVQGDRRYASPHLPLALRCRPTGRRCRTGGARWATCREVSGRGQARRGGEGPHSRRWSATPRTRRPDLGSG